MRRALNSNGYGTVGVFTNDGFAPLASLAADILSHAFTAPPGGLREHSAGWAHERGVIAQADELDPPALLLNLEPIEHPFIEIKAFGVGEILEVEVKKARFTGEFAEPDEILAHGQGFQRKLTRLDGAISHDQVQRAEGTFIPILEAGERIAQLHAGNE